jgi:hypothetical protein
MTRNALTIRRPQSRAFSAATSPHDSAEKATPNCNERSADRRVQLVARAAADS